MRRYSSPGTLAYSFGPGPMSFAVKVLIWTNIAVFLAAWVMPSVTGYLGLVPAEVVHGYRFWQPVTYMFVHSGVWHIL